MTTRIAFTMVFALAVASSTAHADGNDTAGAPIAQSDAASPNPTPTTTTDNVVITAAPPKRDHGALLLGVKAGGLFSEAFSPMGPSFLVDVEVGYALPVLHRGLALLLDAGYTQPTANGGRMDPRIDANAGAYTWDLTQRELLVGATLVYRATMILDGRLVPYVGVGPRMWLLQSKVTGAAGDGNPIFESTEQSTKFGVSVPLGLELKLGPGGIFAEAQLLWAPIDHRVTGDSSVGSITASAGYRVQLGF